MKSKYEPIIEREMERLKEKYKHHVLSIDQFERGKRDLCSLLEQRETRYSSQDVKEIAEAFALGFFYGKRESEGELLQLSVEKELRETKIK